MKKTASIQVIDRATLLLQAVCRYDKPVALKRLAADTGLSLSTTHRILESLVQNDLVSRLERGMYRPGVKLHALSVGMNTSVDLRAIAIPVMENLSERMRVAVHLTIREGDKVLYIDRAVPRKDIGRFRLIGRRAPLHVTSVGKLWLAEEGELGIEAYAKRTNLPAYTPKTITKLDLLIRECQVAQSQQVGFDRGEAEVRVGCVGALVRDKTQRAVAGISLSGDIEQAGTHWVTPVRQAAMEVSKVLGYKQIP